ncbi:DMT family transporter [Paenibacillus albiflavus]|uniref:DMT family transporter n=1 Tax=Paenibacillus albiflavus TaxID=2545760 RepID=A0A4R4EFY9_9BACL|nr:DMT family transporter [Paenibacillus albiflavus]TCZ77151.1 DMT family transporter [Paenibacillus albiflavus]
MKIKGVIFLIGISFIWGSQFFFTDIIISSVSPVTLAAAKAFVGAITLTLIYILFSKKEQSPIVLRYPRKRLMLLYTAIAFFEAIIPFFLIGWGQQRVSSSMASIIMGTIPIFTLLILFLFKVSRLRLMHFISIGVGFVGILLIILPSLTIDITNQSLWGMAALIFASLSFAISLVLIEKLPPMSSVLAMRNILFIASIVLIPASFILESPLSIRLTSIEILCLLILGIFHAGIVYMMFNLLIQQSGAAFASLTNYFVPVIGVILGTVLLGDQIDSKTWLALLVILISSLLGSIASKSK